MQALDDIYRDYADLVYRFVFSKARDEFIAEEVTQETFYQAVRCIDRFDGSCKISTWLCGIAKNQLAVYLRKNRIHEDIDELGECISAEQLGWQGSGQTPSVLSPEASILETESRMALMKELHSLQEPYREVLYLRVFGELSFKEIGEIMEKSENWARVTFYRAKEKLRKEEK